MTRIIRGILVNVPQYINECLILMAYGRNADPVRREFLDRVHHEISVGISKAHLIPARVDESTNSDTVKEIFLRIKTSEVIIADCSPDPVTNLPNPNVLYELGIAHALGRPTIILAAEGQILPHDLRNLKQLKYNLADVCRNHDLSKAICSELKALTERLSGNYNDPEWGETYKIRAVDARFAVCLDSRFLHYFTIIVNFSQMVRRHLQPLDNILPHLKSYVYNIVHRPPDEVGKDTMELLEISWKAYSDNYESVRSHIFENALSSYLLGVDDSLKYIANLSEINKEAFLKKAVSDALDFYNELKDILLHYSESHDKVARIDPRQLAQDYMKSRLNRKLVDFYTDIERMRLLIQIAVFKSHNLIDSMTSILKDEQ